MSATATLPLPLELTEPAEVCDQEAQLKELFGIANTKYNPETQVREDALGVPQILNGITISLQLSTVIGIIVQDNDKQQDDEN